MQKSAKRIGFQQRANITRGGATASSGGARAPSQLFPNNHNSECECVCVWCPKWLACYSEDLSLSHSHTHTQMQNSKRCKRKLTWKSSRIRRRCCHWLGADLLSLSLRLILGLKEEVNNLGVVFWINYTNTPLHSIPLSLIPLNKIFETKGPQIETILFMKSNFDIGLCKVGDYFIVKF